MEVNQNILDFDFQVWYPGPICCSKISLSSVSSLKNQVRISWPEGRQVSFSSSIFSCMKRSRTKCLQTSVSSLLEGLGRVDLVLARSSFHQLISLMPVSLMLAARLKAQTTLCLVSLCLRSTIRQISLNSSSICLSMRLYSSSSVFLFLRISTSTYLMRSNSSSSILRLSSLSLAMLPTEFLLGMTRWSLWMALPQMQFTQSSLNSFQQYSVMKLLWIRHFCGSSLSQDTRQSYRQVQKFYLRLCRDQIYSA